MNEFNNRMTAQRKIIQTINRQSQTEELFGLSAKAIDRWMMVNQLDPESHLVTLIKAASAKLFFLSSKSQEQVTEEYHLASHQVSALHELIDQELSRS